MTTPDETRRVRTSSCRLVAVASNPFFRLTVQADYMPDANGIFYYSVWVNGLPSTNPQARYAAADASQPWFGEIAGNGGFLLDDLVVGTPIP